MPDRLVNLTSFGSVEEAHMAKNALEAEGLHAFLDGETSVGNLWHLGAAMGGVKLMVPEDEIARAQEILDRDDDEDEDEHEADTRVTGERPKPALDSETRITDVRPTPDVDIEDTDADLRRDDDDLDEPTLTNGQVLATRAFRCAVLAFIMPLLIPYSLWVLLTVYGYDGELDETSQRKLFWASIINGVVVLGIVTLLRFMR
jgi:hypothetical protein